jgi:hypothetical protein
MQIHRSLRINADRLQTLALALAFVVSPPSNCKLFFNFSSHLPLPNHLVFSVSGGKVYNYKGQRTIAEFTSFATGGYTSAEVSGTPLNVHHLSAHLIFSSQTSLPPAPRLPPLPPPLRPLPLSPPPLRSLPAPRMLSF